MRRGEERLEEWGWGCGNIGREEVDGGGGPLPKEEDKEEDWGKEVKETEAPLEEHQSSGVERTNWEQMSSSLLTSSGDTPEDMKNLER